MKSVESIVITTVSDYIDSYGIEKNLIVLVEELAELQQSVCKYLRHSNNAVIRKNKNEIIDDIRTEIADTLYCLHYLLGITNNTWADYMEMVEDRAFENRMRLGEVQVE